MVIPLNAAIGAAAERHGWVRVPVQAWSRAHGYCAGNARWFRTEEDARNIQGPYEVGFSFRDSLPPGFQFSLGSLHPNPAGHEGIAQQIVSTALPTIGVAIGGVPIKEKSRDEIYVIYGGAKFYIPDPPTLHRLFGSNPTIVTVPDGALTQVPLVPRDGTLIKELDDRIHVVYGGAKFYIPDPPTFQRLFGDRPVVTVPHGALAQVPLVPRDGTLIKELDDGRIHVTYGDAKFYIPDPPTLKKLFGENPSIVTVPDGALTQVPLIPRDGTLIKELDDRIHIVYGGAKFYIPDPPTFQRLCGDRPVMTVPHGALTQVPLIPRDGTLIKELDDRIHIVYGGAKFYIPDPPTYRLLFGDRLAVTVPHGALTQVPLVPRDGTLIKELTDQKIYLIRNGTKYWISTPEQFRELGFAEEAVRTVPNGALGAMPDRSNP
ncbi:MAG: hypothetical protein P0120_20005 [Nitrospira sp.]|nr:hypothetical protein [Nitrospira sp.]